MSEQARAIERIEELRRKALANPSQVGPLVELSNSLRALGALEEALDCAHQASDLAPKDSEVLANLGLCHLNAGHLSEAEEAFRQAAELQPDVAVHYHNRAVALQRQGRLEDAVEAFRQASEVAPNVPVSFVSMAPLLSRLGNRRQSAAAYRRAYELDPESESGLLHLAQSFIELGDYSAAEGWLVEAIRRHAKSYRPYVILARVLQQQGRFDEATSNLRKAIRRGPERARSYFDFVTNRKTTAEDASILGQIEELLARTRSLEDQALLHYALGKAADDQVDYEVAMRHFEAANERMLALQAEPFDSAAHAAYFDDLIKTFDSQRMSTPLIGSSPSELPILVVGMIRSGTTLIEQILSSHPRIGGGGELPFWPTRLRGLFDGETGQPKRDVLAVTQDYLALLEDLGPGMDRVTDKLPHNYAFLGAIHLLFPNARIIHCRRQPLDTALSIFVTPFATPIRYAHSRENIVAYYRQYQRLMDHWRQVIPADRLLEIDYEAVVSQPEVAARQMIDFVGLEWDEACLRPERNDSIIKTPSLWQARQPIHGKSLERWKNYEPWLGALSELSDGEVSGESPTRPPID